MLKFFRYYFFFFALVAVVVGCGFEKCFPVGAFLCVYILSYPGSCVYSWQVPKIFKLHSANPLHCVHSGILNVKFAIFLFQLNLIQKSIFRAAQWARIWLNVLRVLCGFRWPLASFPHTHTQTSNPYFTAHFPSNSHHLFDTTFLLNYAINYSCAKCKCI